MSIGTNLMHALKLINDACDDIQEGNMCYRCPLECSICGETFSIEEFYYNMSEDSVDDMLRLAEWCRSYISDEDAEALWADNERKMWDDE